MNEGSGWLQDDAMVVHLVSSRSLPDGLLLASDDARDEQFVARFHSEFRDSKDLKRIFIPF